MIDARSGSGCLRPPWVAGAVLLLAIATAPAGAQRKPSCIPDDPCGDPNVVAACEEFRSCQSTFRDELTACVEDKCQCAGGETDEGEPKGCRFPITPGRCTITLECVHLCARETTRLPDIPSTTACVRDLKAALQGPDKTCRVTSGGARRACKVLQRDGCVLPIPRACTPAFEDRGSGCQQDCIRRVLEEVAVSKDCYSHCGSRCDDNGCATQMCERACRNSACNALRKHCSPEGADDGDSEVDPDLRRLNIGYRVCCENPNRDCDADSEETLLCTPTTTSSTSTSSSSTSSSTASSTATTTSTLAVTVTTVSP